jgi:arsenate reductase (thioredoxin)
MSPKKNVLVLCAHNSARSQMTEAFLRKHGGDRFTVHSAGLHATEIHPLTRRVMAEVGLPLEGQHAKPVRDFLGKLAVHHLIIVCERTERECPKAFLGAMQRHFWPFPDPATVEGDPEKQLTAFREVRDDIERRVREWIREEES